MHSTESRSCSGANLQQGHREQRPSRKEQRRVLHESMNKQRIAILLIFTFASSFSLTWGLIRARLAKGTEVDYKVVYIGARCLLRHCDPYNRDQLMKVYFDEGGERLPPPPPGYRQHYLVAEQLYPPTAELFFVPFALFSWPTAYFLWVGTTFVLLSCSAFLIWSVAAGYAPDPPFYLTCIILANSGILLASGNPAGIAVSLCVIGVWCIVQSRFVWLGVFCLACSLAIKPHDTALVWLALMVVGGSFRRRALQSFAIMAAFAVASFVWFQQISPGWMHELQSNVFGYSTGGSRNDPAGATAPGMVNLQPMLTLVRNDPRFYNLAALAILAPIFLAWIYVTLRSRRTREEIWLGLAGIACLTLLPLYHRSYDAKILILTLPACAILTAKRGPVAWVALALTSLGVLVTSDLPVAALDIVAPPFPSGAVGSNLLFLILGRPAGLVILCLSAFYVWAYARFSKIPAFGRL